MRICTASPRQSRGDEVDSDGQEVDSEDDVRSVPSEHPPRLVYGGLKRPPRRKKKSSRYVIPRGGSLPDFVVVEESGAGVPQGRVGAEERGHGNTLQDGIGLRGADPRRMRVFDSKGNMIVNPRWLAGVSVSGTRRRQGVGVGATAGLLDSSCLVRCSSDDHKGKGDNAAYASTCLDAFPLFVALSMRSTISQVLLGG